MDIVDLLGTTEGTLTSTQYYDLGGMLGILFYYCFYNIGDYEYPGITIDYPPGY
jgi:hypothetical protein